MIKYRLLSSVNNPSVNFPKGVKATQCVSHTHKVITKGTHGVSIQYNTHQGTYCNGNSHRHFYSERIR